MLTSLSSNAITAKARAIYGRRLTAANYNELLKKTSVSEITSYLKEETSYSKYLANVDETSIHRGRLELLLRRSLFDKFFSLCHYDFSRGKGFYHYVIERAEIDALLDAIMLLNSNSQHEIIINLPTFMQEFVSFDFDKLARINSFSDLLDVVSGTSYKKTLERMNAPNGEINFSECELALYTKYYTDTLKSIDKQYKGKTAKLLRSVVLGEIELKNIGFIYRLRFLLKKPPEFIKRHLLPFSYKLTESQLDKLITDGDISEENFVKSLRLNRYDTKIKNVDFKYIENYTNHLLYFISRKFLRFSYSAPLVFFSLMTLTETEIQNLTIIIEGVRYGNPSSEIKSLLIQQ